MTFMDLDYIKYMLGFPGVKMVLYPNGTWQIKLEQNCRFLTVDNLCDIHKSEDQPKTCSFYNPYNCFYKRNFSEDGSREILQIDRDIFQSILEIIQLDDQQNIVAIPTWDEMVQMTTK